MLAIPKETKIIIAIDILLIVILAIINHGVF